MEYGLENNKMQHGYDDISSDINREWQDIFATLQTQLGDKLATRWLSKITPDKIENGQALLWVPSPCIGELVNQNYADQILSLWQQKNNAVSGLKFTVKSVLSAVTKPVESAPVVTKPFQKIMDEDTSLFAAHLNPNYTFDSFIVGKPNEFAYAAARRVAEDLNASFNPLYLHSSVGLGKTHLMHAIAWRLKEMHPEKSVLYLSSEQFVNHFVKATMNKTVDSFKHLFRTVDVLMIDDVQFICGKPATQEEFFHTFNALIEQGKKIILSSDSVPTELKGIEDRLKTRLAQGLVVDIHPTTYELRLAILLDKIEKMHAAVPKEVVELLAEKITTNVRELEGALKRLVAHAELIGTPITMDSTKRILSDVLQACEREITVSSIQQEVADYFLLKLADLKSTRRDRKIARPRQVAMYLAKNLTTLSLPDIAKAFDRDHTTVMHAVKTIEKIRMTDRAVAEDIALITRRLQNGGV